MKKILNKIFEKININKSDPLKDEKKNEELIEKIVDDHKGVYNWPDEDLKLIEILSFLGLLNLVKTKVAVKDCKLKKLKFLFLKRKSMLKFMTIKNFFFV